MFPLRSICEVHFEAANWKWVDMQTGTFAMQKPDQLLKKNLRVPHFSMKKVIQPAKYNNNRKKTTLLNVKVALTW